MSGSALLRAATLLSIVSTAACGGDREADEAQAPPSAAAESASAAPAVPDTGLTVQVQWTGDLAYALQGTAPVPVLQVSVEDGHNVLFGPAEVQVADGRFSIDLEIEPTEMPTVFAYITTPSGDRQWVVPIPRGQESVTWSSGRPGN